MKEQQIEARKQKGMEIAKTARITRTDKGWKVPSQSGAGHYFVVSNGFEAKCDCPDYETRRCKCKHVFAVEYIVAEVDDDGNVTVKKAMRKTYPQNWKAYDTASINQKLIFMKLLKDITDNI